ncbi:MAG: methyltransferase family protein [Planctomycetota bacterium]|jgi:protein-S-isoprenylcysteine O-methyltransferase Ste14
MSTVFKTILDRLGIVRHSLKKDLLTFFIPFFSVFFLGLVFCHAYGEGLHTIWGVLWGLITRPHRLFETPLHRIIGLFLFIGGLSLMIVSQATLWKNYSGFVVIKKDHRLITHGIYRYTRNPIYLGAFIGITGLSVYAASWLGFLVMMVLVPITLNRIRLEEELLADEFKQAYQSYIERTKRLIPFIY